LRVRVGGSCGFEVDSLDTCGFEVDSLDSRREMMIAKLSGAEMFRF